MRALIYCNFLREVRLGGWGSEGPKGPTLGQYVECVRYHSVRKWKYIMRFEIRYFFLEIIYFSFPRACVRQYTVSALLYMNWSMNKEAWREERWGWGVENPIIGKFRFFSHDIRLTN